MKNCGKINKKKQETKKPKLLYILQKKCCKMGIRGIRTYIFLINIDDSAKWSSKSLYYEKHKQKDKRGGKKFKFNVKNCY